MTVSVVLAIAGVIALFLSIWGGGIKAKEIEIPPTPRKARTTVGFVGIIFIGISIWLSTTNTISSSSENMTQNISPTNVVSPTISPTIIPSPTAINGTEAIISRSKVDEWSLGETNMETVTSCLNETEKIPAPFISFEKGDTIPRGVLLATGFWIDGGVHWNELPVRPICIYDDWGLFESLDEFQAVSPGSYRQIVP